MVSFAHKGWYMQPGVNFSFIDDLAHKYGIDLHIAGHIHTYQVCYSLFSRTTWIDDVFPQLTRMPQRFYPLRSSPLGPNPSRPNNRPADVDFDCASTGVQTAEAVFKNYTIINNTYTE